MTTLTSSTEHPRSLRADEAEAEHRPAEAARDRAREAALAAGAATDVPLQQEPEIIEAENPAQFGFMQSMLSCACTPCPPALDLTTSTIVTALPSRTASVPKSGEAGMGGEEADQHVLQF